jgi:hypothetical protein
VSDPLGIDLDLNLSLRAHGWRLAGPGMHLDLTPAQGTSGRLQDLGRVKGRTNLAQALVLRLLTEKGELATLGHADYGSEHLRLIGEPNTQANRNLLRLYILDALRRELRVASVAELRIERPQGTQGLDTVDIHISLIVRDDPVPLSLVVPFSFAGDAA